MKKLITLLAVLISIQSLSAQTAEPKPILFIVDASGSMWQKIGDEYKISIARDVLDDLVARLPENQQFGLIAYGHRQKGDCDDIEQLLPLTNKDKSAFTSALKGLNPTGMTPLARSAKQAVAALKSNKAAASVILITDGEETCDGELCAVVKQAKAEGIDLIFHIVGFDMKTADRSPLECAANATGGLYVDAENREQLAEAVTQTTDLALEDPDGRLSVKVVRNSELVDATVRVYKDGQEIATIGKRTYSSESTNPAKLMLPTGTFDLKVELVSKRGIAPQWKRGVQVTNQDHLEVFDFSSGKISIKVSAMGEPHDATVRIYSKATEKQVEGGRTYTGPRHNPMVKELSGGAYYAVIKSVSIKGDAIEKRLDFSVTPGQTTELSHEFQHCTLKVGATAGSALTDATVNIVSTASGKAATGSRTYTSSKTNPKPFLLSPGTYEVTVKGIKIDGNPKKVFTITLKAGETKEKMIGY